MEVEDFANFLDEDIFIEDDIDNQIDGDIEEDNIILEEKKDIFINKERKEKITPPVMTNFEKVNIISQRIKQLDSNFKTTLPKEVAEKNISKSIDIAMLEFDNKALPPLYVIRPFPDGSYEKWRLNEFEVFP